MKKAKNDSTKDTIDYFHKRYEYWLNEGRPPDGAYAAAFVDTIETFKLGTNELGTVLRSMR